MNAGKEKHARFPWLMGGQKRQRILHALSRHPGDDPSMVAMQFNISDANLGNYISQFKRRGYVTTCRFHSFTEVWMTEKGKRAVEEIEKTIDFEAEAKQTEEMWKKMKEISS